LGLRGEEVLAEGGDGVDDGAVVRSVQRLVDVTLGRLPVSGGCWLESKFILNKKIIRFNLLSLDKLEHVLKDG
jgi:hypothetical protein